MLTDSPAVRAAVEREFVELDGRVVVTDGAYGNVKFANSGVCVQHGAKQSGSCDASDPRPAWERSMMDLYLVGRVDAVLMLYQSKFSVAAMMRGAVRYGQRELYQNTRITHSLVDPLVNEMKNGGWSGANEERKRMWTAVGPVRSGGKQRGVAHILVCQPVAQATHAQNTFRHFHLWLASSFAAPVTHREGQANLPMPLLDCHPRK